MRPLVLPLAALIACAPTLPPMAPQPEPMEGANRLIVALPGEPEAAYRRLAAVLQEQGYHVVASDGVLLNLTTSWQSPTGTGVEVRIAGRVTADSATAVVLTGEGRVGALGQFRAEDRGASGSALRQAWSGVLRVARALGGPILYARD